MFFEQERLNPTLIDVLHIQQSNTKSFNKNRVFHALSFRFRSDAVLETEKKQYQLTDNTLTFMPAFQDYTRTAATEDMIAILFYLEGHDFQEIETYIPQRAEEYAVLFENIWHCWTEKKPGYILQCTAILYEILALAHAEHAPQTRTNVYNEKIHAGVEYLIKHFQNPDLTVAQLAKQCFMSEVYFRKLFQQSFGISPKQYLMQLRLEHAEQLLQRGYYSLQEVSNLCGFNDYKYFSTEFKRVHGISPSQFRYK